MSYDDTARRNYWTDQLDKAYAFIMKGLEVTVAECGERLVSLVDAVERAGVDVVFSGRPHVHGLPRLFVLREGLIDNFLNAVRRLNQQGWVLRVEDGYRSRTMQKGVGLMPFLFDDILHKVVWELEGRLPDPDFLFKRMLTLVAQIPKCAPHMSGAAIDMSVLDRSTGAEVDRGAPYLEISEITPINTPFVSAEARRNRREITAIMRESGFAEYPFEFWHYGRGEVLEEVLQGTGRPIRYGAVDYDPTTGKVTPIEEPWKPLNSLEEIQAEIHASIQRHRRAHSLAEQ